MDHTVVHFEIPADDPERAVGFYRELFGWEFQKWGGPAEGGPEAGMEYWLITTVPTDESGRPQRPGVNGGLMRRQDPNQPAVNYVSVESVHEFARKAETLGGSVIVPRNPVPGMGWFAYVKDTEGNIFGLWESDESAA